MVSFDYLTLCLALTYVTNGNIPTKMMHKSKVIAVHSCTTYFSVCNYVHVTVLKKILIIFELVLQEICIKIRMAMLTNHSFLCETIHTNVWIEVCL